MNTLVIVLIAAVCLFGAYALYGRWLANKWGIDPTAKTPAVVHEDGRDYVPTDGWTVFAHQFSSIAGAGPVTGAIQAAAFGWLPVLLREDGTIFDEDSGALLEPDTVVSMNFWGFMPSIFQELEAYFDHFLRCEAGDNIKAECLLPGMVGDLLEQGRLEVSVLHSADRWFGMTYHEDRQAVAAELQKLHAGGVYPPTLRA